MSVYSVATLAEHWGCGQDTVYALIRGGDLPAFRVGGKLLRIRDSEVEQYECRTNTASNDSEANSPSSGTQRENATATRLERLIERQPKPQPDQSGRAEAGR